MIKPQQQSSESFLPNAAGKSPFTTKSSLKQKPQTHGEPILCAGSNACFADFFPLQYAGVLENFVRADRR
jgi:hypothetical protein